MRGIHALSALVILNSIEPTSGHAGVLSKLGAGPLGARVSRPLIRESLPRPAQMAAAVASTSRSRTCAVGPLGTKARSFPSRRLSAPGRLTKEAAPMMPPSPGDRAMAFVWRNKGALTVATGLSAFLHDPRPFWDGARDLARIIGGTAMQPVTEGVREASRSVNWTIVLLVVGLVIAARYGVRCFPNARRQRS